LTNVASPWDRVRIRVTGSPAQPTLIYLPGLHGDWTLVASFKAALGNNVRFVEVTYPRTITWSLHDYASAIVQALLEAGIQSGWLLAESFGSQPAWQMLKLAQTNAQAPAFAIQGIILSAGFVRHPCPWIVPLTQKVNRAVPIRFLRAVCRVYAAYAKFRHRRAPETLSHVHEFVTNRSDEADRAAIAHRYTLIYTNDFCEVARAAKVPVYQLMGFFDPVVPWIFVRRWLQRSCPAYRGSKLIYNADHNVLGTAPSAAAATVLDWMLNNCEVSAASSSRPARASSS
jgi:pimeloyl-ACP methyl ester carboxylesterase